MPANCRTSFAKANPARINVALSARSLGRAAASGRTPNSLTRVSLMRAGRSPNRPGERLSVRPPEARSVCGRRNNRRGLDHVNVGEVLVQIRLSLRRDRTLVRSLTVSAIQFLDDVHARGDLPKGSKSLAIQKRVVAEIDEQLCRARIRPCGRKRDRARSVALPFRIVLDIGALPDLVDPRVGA